MTESDDDLAKYLVARTVATEPQTVELTFQRPLTPGLLYLLKNTAKDTPIHHLARRLDPLATSIYPEKRDYLSLRNKINSIIRRVEDSRLTLPDTRCTREERRGFLLAGFCVPRRPSLAKAKKSGKKRKASNEGKDDSYPFYLPAFLFSNSPFFLDTTNIDSIKTDHPLQARR